MRGDISHRGRKGNFLPGEKEESWKTAIREKEAAKQKTEGGCDAVTLKESEIQAQIRDYLRWTGWFVVKIHQSLGSYRGIADLYALRDGQHVWIEVKRPDGRQSEYQKRFQRDIEKHGGTYILARGIEDVEHLAGEKQLQLDRR